MKTPLTLLFVCFFSYCSFAQLGTLDSSFGKNGKVLNENYSATLSKIALQSDGKIIGCGAFYLNSYLQFSLICYNKNGTIDSSFGENGLSGKQKITISSVAIQQDDKIITTGYTTVALKVSRYTKKGLLDKTFGDKGVVTTDLSKHEYSSDIAIQPDQKIVVCGWVRNNPNEGHQGFLVRYLSNGELDRSFGDTGVVIFLPPDRNSAISVVTGMALQKDGKIAVALTYVSDSRSVVYRFNKDGSMDNSFDKDGRAFFSSKSKLTKSFGVTDIVIQQDGKIVGCGFGEGGSSGYKNQMAVSRLNADGSIDSNFGIKGLSTVVLNNDLAQAQSVLLQPDGKIIATGSEYPWNQSYSYYLIARLNRNGSLDSTFSENGLQTTFISGQDFSVSSIFQADGKLIAAGNSYTDSNYNSLVRYNNMEAKTYLVSNINHKEINETISKNIKLSPNPAKNNLHVEGLSTSNKKTLTVIDFMGNIKLQAVANNNSYNLNIASLPAGNYLLKIEMNGEIITKKFLKE